MHWDVCTEYGGQPWPAESSIKIYWVVQTIGDRITNNISFTCYCLLLDHISMDRYRYTLCCRHGSSIFCSLFLCVWVALFILISPIFCEFDFIVSFYNAWPHKINSHVFLLLVCAARTFPLVCLLFFHHFHNWLAFDF